MKFEDAPKGTEKDTKKVTEKVTENQRIILNAIDQNPYLSSEVLSSIVGISAVKIRENISKLKVKGLIERIGSNKGGYWILKPKNTDDESIE